MTPTADDRRTAVRLLDKAQRDITIEERESAVGRLDEAIGLLESEGDG